MMSNGIPSMDPHPDPFCRGCGSLSIPPGSPISPEVDWAPWCICFQESLETNDSIWLCISPWGWSSSAEWAKAVLGQKAAKRRKRRKSGGAAAALLVLLQQHFWCCCCRYLPQNSNCSLGEASVSIWLIRHVFGKSPFDTLKGVTWCPALFSTPQNHFSHPSKKSPQGLFPHRYFSQTFFLHRWSC